MHKYFYLCLALFLCVETIETNAQVADDDWITGYNTFLFRSSRDKIFSGSDVRQSLNRERYTAVNYLTIQRLKIHEDDNYRIWGTGSVWYRHDFGDPIFDSRDRAVINFASIQLDKGRTADGFLKAGRIYNYRGLLNQRFDGAEAYYPFENGIELDVYGGSRVTDLAVDVDNSWLTGGRIGYRSMRRDTIGFSWLLSHTENQWDDQKIGGDWFYQPTQWLDLSGNWGYDILAEDIYEFQVNSLAQITRDFDIRLIYDNVIPGLLIPKSSIFSVFSLAEEERISTQFIYHPGRQWEFLTDFTYVNFDNEGGQGNFFSDINALNGGYQWRYGIEVIYRYSLYDELSFRFEQLMEGNYGYTITDLIRTNFDFRDYDFANPPPEDQGFAFGELENGFSSISFSHWHEWSPKFYHALNFYYYNYDNPLFLHEQGDDSYSANLTFTYKPNRTWNYSIGGRYLNSLADSDGLQAFVRITTRF